MFSEICMLISFMSKRFLIWNDLYTVKCTVTQKIQIKSLINSIIIIKKNNKSTEYVTVITLNSGNYLKKSVSYVHDFMK